MNTTIDKINNDPLKWFELEKESRAMNGFTLYLVHAYKMYPKLDKEEKMCLICEAMEKEVRERFGRSNQCIHDGDPFDGLFLTDF